MINLNDYKRQVYSQGGEDGIIEKIFEVLGIKNGWYCEFGAGDGNWISNTKKLREEGWKGVLIEGDDESFVNLESNFGNHPDVSIIKSYVSCEENESLDDLLSNTNIPENFDLLSIDVDGNDLWIWKSLNKYDPKIVVVEYNAMSKPTESLTIKYDKNHRFNSDSYYGASAGAFNKLAEEKGYVLVGSTPRTNLFYCKKELSVYFTKMELNAVDQGIGWPKSSREMIEY
jgi:hypothetical protein